jgi:hypothetical protein
MRGERGFMSRLCDNVYQQSVGEPLRDTLLAHGLDLDAPAPSRPYRMRHVVSPFAAAPGSQAERVQALTFAAMDDAAAFAARESAGQVPLSITFRAAVQPGDAAFAGRFFPDTVPLARSAADLRAFQVPRPLPLVFDVIEAAVDDGCDHVILTNVDICPLPHFYRAVARFLDLGFDALIINRRTLADASADPSLLPLWCADPGRIHEGYDCFVFSTAAARRFVRNDACVGAGGVMRGLIYDMVATAARMLILTDVHLTCHLGDDKTWTRPDLRDYIDHNWQEAISVLRKVAAAQPDRFADFCAALPDRVRVERDAVEGIRLSRAPGSQGSFPRLDP